METPVTTPPWLSDNVPDLSPVSKEVIDIYPTTTNGISDREQKLTVMFTHVIHKLSDGLSFKAAVESGPYKITPVSMMKWIQKDQNRYKELEETQAAMAEIDMLDIVDIADANGTLEDVSRSTARISARKSRAEVYNRKKFGKDPSFASISTTNHVTISYGSVVPAIATTPETILDVSPRMIDHATQPEQITQNDPA